MSTVGWILLGIGATLMAVALILIVRLLSSLRRLETEVEVLRNDLVELSQRADSFAPLLADTRSALRKAQNERLRADDLLQTATSLTGTADSAARLAVSIVSSPVVRVLSFFAGVKRGLSRLVGRSGTTPPAAPAVVVRRNGRKGR